MIEWSDKEKKVLLKEKTSKEAIEKYYEAFPRSNRKKSSLYTYWWWRKQEEKKKIESFEKKVISGSIKVVKKETVKKIVEQVHATIIDYNETPIFEPGDSVRYTRGSLILSPIGIVMDATKKKGIPEKSQKMKVRFDNYNVRDVYCCDYTIVMKGRKE